MPTATKMMLTKEEQALVSKLPANLQAMFDGKWEAETLTSFETEDELVERMTTASYDDFPEVKKMVEVCAQSGKMEDMAFDKMSDGALNIFLYSIGACGVSAIIETSLQSEQLDADGVAAISMLSMARHKLLTMNASK